jgi:hypothetical protein
MGNEILLRHTSPSDDSTGTKTNMPVMLEPETGPLGGNEKRHA